MFAVDKSLPKDIGVIRNIVVQWFKLTNFFYIWQIAIEFQTLLMSATLHHYRVSCISLTINEEFGHWVKHHSIMWFNHFLLLEYENTMWIQHFSMSKVNLLNICTHVKPFISKHDTKYRKIINFYIRVW